MASLATNLAALITSLGTDYKALVASITARPTIPRPPSGKYLVPWQVLTGTAGTPTSGKATWLAIDINNLSVDALGCSCTTAAVGGTFTITLGIYADNGTGMMPNLSNLIASGTINPNSIANKWATITPQTFNGRYWLCFVYVATVAPTTAPQFTMVSNSVNPTMGASSSLAIGTSGRGLTLTGQTGLPTTGTPAQSGSSDVVCMAVRAA